MTRFLDERETLWGMTAVQLIECRRCGHCARCERIPQIGTMAYKSTCLHCGHVGSEEGKLWLTTHCCSEALWAVNEEHLSFLERYVGAELRERRQTEHGWANSALASRLPRWMTSAKNRTEVMAGLARLRERLSRS